MNYFTGNVKNIIISLVHHEELDLTGSNFSHFLFLSSVFLKNVYTFGKGIRGDKINEGQQNSVYRKLATCTVLHLAVC